MDGLSPEAHKLAAIIALVITFWVTEALPLAVTALLGPTLAVMLQVAPIGPAFAPMANPIVFLFIGSFILAQGLFVHRVNERIAYSVLSWKVIGARPTRILIAYGALAAVLSAWMSNTATAAMLVPIGLSLIAFMESESQIPRSYGTAMMLMTAYGCSRGGMATPVGTPPNLITLAMLDDLLDVRISFVEWMLLAMPATVVLMGIAFVYLNWIGRTGVKEIPGADAIIEKRKRALGSWKRGELNALIAFGVTVCLWVGPGLLALLLGREHHVVQSVLTSIPEAVAALTGAVLLFLLPISADQRSTITWKQAAQIDWGTILLFGGGLSLGALSASTGLALAVGEGITNFLPTDSVVPLTFAAALFTVVLSEAMSNTAATTIAIPIVISIAQAAGVDPVVPAVAAGLAASVAVVLPVSTPPNAIVYASGRVPIMQMIKYGLLMDVVAVVLVPAMVLVLM
jgi:sodium-dependent dicarboxylate transporter 2/3/5